MSTASPHHQSPPDRMNPLFTAIDAPFRQIQSTVLHADQTSPPRPCGFGGAFLCLSFRTQGSYAAIQCRAGSAIILQSKRNRFFLHGWNQVVPAAGPGDGAGERDGPARLAGPGRMGHLQVLPDGRRLRTALHMRTGPAVSTFQNRDGTVKPGGAQKSCPPMGGHGLYMLPHAFVQSGNDLYIRSKTGIICIRNCLTQARSV